MKKHFSEMQYPDAPGTYLKVLLIGAGPEGAQLLALLLDDPFIIVVGAVDPNPEAPGIQLAHEANIPIAKDYPRFLRDETLDIVLNVTGDAKLQQKLGAEKLPHTVLIGKKSAKLIWTTLDEREKRSLLNEFLDQGGGPPSASREADFIIGNTPKMKEIANMAIQVAPTPTTVLLRGASGTGKEVVARMIHTRSPWRAKPLITVNCTAFSASLIESELFGYRKGAFTGAVSDRTGLLELADNGTILLDEIGDMPVEMQAKLLRFLQSGEIRAVGDFKTKKVRVRIIAATNRNLEEAMERGEFRRDLFYRLNAFTIFLPTLQERKEDIPLLANHFLKIANKKLGKQIVKFSPAALSALADHHWPGNIRELKNVIERAAVLENDQQIDIHSLPAIFQPQEALLDLEDADLCEGLMSLKARMIDKFEYEAICRYLEASQGNVSRAAIQAQVPRRTFQRLMNKHKISSRLFKQRDSAIKDE